jgi:hypothetical protein
MEFRQYGEALNTVSRAHLGGNEMSEDKTKLAKRILGESQTNRRPTTRISNVIFVALRPEEAAALGYPGYNSMAEVALEEIAIGHNPYL